MRIGYKKVKTLIVDPKKPFLKWAPLELKSSLHLTPCLILVPSFIAAAQITLVTLVTNSSIWLVVQCSVQYRVYLAFYFSCTAHGARVQVHHSLLRPLLYATGQTVNCVQIIMPGIIAIFLLLSNIFL